MKDVLRIANCSGFYGDRLLAAKQMVEGGPIDVLTGDYLAELTMSILWRTRQRDPDKGYAGTFVTQMEQVLGTCLERGIKIVSNAGGINPAGLAERIAKLSADLGLTPRIAFVDGDDLLARMSELMSSGQRFVHMDRGVPLSGLEVSPVTANAYLGGWAISEALSAGADLVITGRVTDAALVVGPSVWNFNWKRDDWDSLAGAVVAGHIIECGAHCTGGNYSFFEEVPDIERIGFPIAELHSDGSSVITKHPGTGGLVSVGTVTAQLLYEIGSPHYLNPDVTSLFESISLTQLGPDRVGVSGVEGEAPPPELKVGINYPGGFKNSMTFGIAAPATSKKAAILESALWEVAGGQSQFAMVDVRLLGHETVDPANNDEAVSYLRVSVMDPDPEKVGRRFSGAAVELALSSYPGFFLTTPPGEAAPYAVFWPATIPADLVPMRVVMDDREWEVSSVVPEAKQQASSLKPPASHSDRQVMEATDDRSALTRVPLGSIAGARSGDKGGNANVGFWVRKVEEYRWMDQYLTTDRLHAMMPEADGLRIERYELPNLLALNFVVRGLLGEGVSSSSRTDPQAKSLGEFLRARWVEVPRVLIEGVR